MTIERRDQFHEGPGGTFRITIAWDSALAGPRPGVLVIPNMLGPKPSDADEAAALAELGYVGLVVDLYGDGNRATRADPDPARFMNALDADRALMRDRLHCAVAELKALPEVDPDRTAAIGFCFGGKAVLDLARSGAALLGGVSLHGIFDPPDYAPVQPIAMKLLICHGWDDPLAPPAATVALVDELGRAGADWQLLAFGGTVHAFTDRSAAAPGRALYHPDADRRARAAMRAFLAELFG